MLDKNNIVPCVDWFRGVLPISCVDTFLHDMYCIDERLNFDMFVDSGRQLLNFSKRFCHVEVPSLTFAFNPDYSSDNPEMTASLTHQNSGILVSLSGDAIRYLGADSLRLLLQLFHFYDVKCTRIDYALDFYDPENLIVPLMQEGCKNFLNPGTRDVTVSGKIKRCTSNWQCFLNEAPGYPTTFNYTLGNHGSDHGMFRLYDKFFEVSYGRHSDRADELLQGHQYWYRAEIELHNAKDAWWANESFYNLVKNDFNIYAIIGYAFDMWFAFKVKRFESNSLYDDIDLWNEFVSELVSNIHFVELVKQPFVTRDCEHIWKEIKRMSKYLSILEDVGGLDPGRWQSILTAARSERDSNSHYKLKYGSILNELEFIVTI